MTKRKSTKRALLLSALSLLMCVSMLVGSTFAWFTDSEVSGSNVIKSGNLDIEVEYTLDGKNWKDLDGANDLFQKGLWEPGHTEVVALKIENKGSLALKYAASMNIFNEVVGTNKDGEPIVLSDILTVSTLNQAANDIGEIALMLAYMGENSVAYETTASFKAGNILKADRELQPGDEHYLFIKVDMAETVGNEANHKGPGFEPAIEFGINILATQFTYENDSFGNQYDKNSAYPAAPIVVHNAEEAQAALDTLKDGSTIQLISGVNYGTLEVRANVKVEMQNNKAVVVPNADNTELVNYVIKPNATTGADTKHPAGEFVRSFKNITIIGAPGAKVDAIKFVNGVDKLTIPATGKQTGQIYRFVEVANLVIDGVVFTDATTVTPDNQWYSPLLFNLDGVHVDGLTVKNCKLEGNNNKLNFVYAYGKTMSNSSFEATLKNVNIVNNTVSGIARLCELREANNVTIQGNTVKNLTRELALLSNNTGKAYSGDINVIGNTADNVAIDYTADGFNALFVRVGIGGDANVVVKDNVITNTTPVDAADFVKVTGHTGALTVENNTLG